MQNIKRFPANNLKKRRRLSFALFPTLLTLGNAVCGMAAIAVLYSQAHIWTPDGQLFTAGLLVFAGMIFDMLDGRVARMTGQSSEFGAQLDSLCDVITFGVVPAAIVWKFAAEVYPERVCWVFGVLFTLCVIMRLARFNVEVKEESSHEVFEGLPSPAAAGAIASFATAIPQISRFQGPSSASWVQELSNRGLESAQYCLPMLAVVLSGLMISRVRYPHVFQQWFSGHRSPYQIGQMIFGALIIFVFHEVAVPLIFLYFAFESPIRQWTLSRVAALREDRDRSESEKMIDIG